MLFHQVFSSLLEQQPALFSKQDREELLTLIPTLPNDLDKISDTLATWCESRSQLHEAISSSPLLAPGEKGLNSHIQRDEAKEYKEQIINALLQSKPAPTPPTTTTVPPPNKPK